MGGAPHESQNEPNLWLCLRIICSLGRQCGGASAIGSSQLSELACFSPSTRHSISATTFRSA
ncbi:hypothetical protein ACFPRL_23945 [Pseudoclavibacter helvolus]